MLALVVRESDSLFEACVSEFGGTESASYAS